MSRRYAALLRGLIGTTRERAFGIDDRTRAHRARLVLRTVMLGAREKIPKRDYPHFVDWLTQQNLFLTATFTPLEVGNDNLDGVINARRSPIDHELAWIAARMLAIGASIGSFLQIKREIELAVWAGDGKLALAKCDALAQRHGNSIWALKTRAGLLQLHDGIGSQKEYTTSVKKTLGRGLAAFIAHYIGIRNEPSVTAEGFSALTRRVLAKTNLPAEQTSYLFYQLLDELPEDASNVADVLRIEQSHSDIDVYEALIAALIHLASRTHLRHIVSSLAHDLTKLATATGDDRLKRILIVAQADYTVLNDLRSRHVWTLLERSPPRSIAKDALSNLRQDPSDLLSRVALALTLADSRRPISDESSIGRRTIRLIKALFQKDSSFDQSTEQLQKLASSLATLQSFSAVGALCRAEHSSSYLLESPKWREVLARYSAPLPEVAPTWQPTSPTEVSRVVELTCIAESELTETQQLLLSSLASSSNRVIALRASFALIASCCRTQRFSDACIRTANHIVRHLVPQSALDLAGLFAGLQWRDLKPIRDRPEAPIALRLLSDADPDSYRSMVRFAVAEYLYAVGADRPSLIAMPSNQNDLSLHVFFLRNVCTVEYMENIPSLSGSPALESERIEICNQLARIDPVRAPEYEREVVDITRRRLVAQGIRLVDSTRIHVDHEAIRSACVKVISEDYSRYQYLLSAGLSEDVDLESLLRELGRLNTGAGEQLHFPSSEANLLFASMVQVVRDRFLSDAVHGLDAYLSRRIRHGTIVGEIRGPLERHRLATDRLDTKRYSRNDYWNEQLAGGTGDRVAFLRELELFNRDFDNELIRIKDRALHLRSKEKPLGLFDVPLSATMLRLVQARVTSTTSIEAFCDATIQTLWLLLDSSLEAARAVLGTELKEKVTRLFHQLQIAASEHCAACTAYNELQRAISRCSDEVRASIDTVTGWFDRADTAALSQTFTLEQACAIALESVLSANKAFNPKIEIVHSDQRPLLAPIVTNMTDILHVAISNARAHSGCPSACEMKISTSIHDSPDVVRICVANNTSESARAPQALKVLEDIRASIASGAFLSDVAREGRSGLKKLASTFARLPGGRVEFGFNGSDQFVLEVDLPVIN